jgi:hypothetical protein
LPFRARVGYVSDSPATTQERPAVLLTQSAGCAAFAEAARGNLRVGRSAAFGPSGAPRRISPARVKPSAPRRCYG